MRLDLVHPAVEKVTLALEGIGAGKGSREFVEFGPPFGDFAPTRASKSWGSRR
jgi:hypothetical protein